MQLTQLVVLGSCLGLSLMCVMIDRVCRAVAVLCRLPTLASVHSNQPTIEVSMQMPLEQQPGTQIVPFLTADIRLCHSQLHLLLCPWQSSVHRVLRALAGRPDAIYQSGIHAVLCCTPCCSKVHPGVLVRPLVRHMMPLQRQSHSLHVKPTWSFKKALQGVIRPQSLSLSSVLGVRNLCWAMLSKL